MKTTSSRLQAACGGVLFALFAVMGARADDTEIFFSQNIGNIPANILFILDTSGSMNDTVTTQVDYDPSKSYSADSCPSGSSIDNNSYYFSNKGAPTCSSTNKINMKQFVCTSMMSPIDTSGYATDAFIMWGSTTSNGKPKKTGGVTTTTSTQTYKWQSKLDATNTAGYVECKLDAGQNGDGTAANDTLLPYATTDTYSIITQTDTPPGTVTVTTKGTASTTGLWVGQVDAAKNYFKSGTGTVYTIYTPNYLNWLYDSKQKTTASKMWIMRGAASSLLNSLQGVNVGLARYNNGGSGGMILAPVAPIDTGTNRKDMIDLVNSWAPAGITPLSETLYEAYLYFSGGTVLFGASSTSTRCNTWTTTDYTCSAATKFSAPSVPASRTGGTASSKTYDSPADYSCRKNFVVYLTDGLPNENDQADTAIQALPNFTQLGGACDAKAFSGATGGLCTAALAQYMYNADLRPDVQKVQNVTSYFIGFGADFQSGGAPTAAFNYLQNAATRGGGKAYTADSLAGLTDAFNKILGDVMKTNTTFSAPAVAVNAFNRTQTLNDLYVSVFSPSMEYHWPGNVKKYKLVDGVVTDALGRPAVDGGSGFFIDGSQSFWSTAPDDADVKKGGAASNLPDFSKRTIYSTEAPGTGGYPKLIGLNDSKLTATDFVLGAADPAQADLVNWAYGQDVLDRVGVTDGGVAGTADTRHQMGDPIHTQPVAVIYGKNGQGGDDTVIYAPTNDGYLHAIDASADPTTGADIPGTSGAELWAFVPHEMLPQLKNLYVDDSQSGTYVKHYGLDGAITVLKYDVNGDGTISGDDRVILFFGTGRNASTSAYYALDVTNKAKPELLWKIDASTLPNLGQAWSQPVITRVNIGGATQNSQKLVLVIGGGYDAAEDNYTYQAADNVGKAVYMVDAIYGTLVWSAGQSGATLNLARMDHSISAPVSVLDLDGDTYADRLYFGDTAAQLWRIDLTNGSSAATLATGGVLASLGTHDDLLHLAINTRRFYSQVDASLEQKPGSPSFINLAIGTGYRGHPLDGTANDRFYAVRDYDAFTAQTQAWFDGYTIIRDAISGGALATNKLLDITATAAPVIPVGAAGWQLDMNTHPDWTSGEKVLAPSRTFNGQVIFTSYEPNTLPPTDPCTGVGTGTNRVYVVDVFNGAPVIDRNKDGTLTTGERSQDLRQGGIAPEAAFLFPAPGGSGGNGGGGGGGGGPGGGPVTCLSGVEVLNVCSNLNRVRKTYWREGAAN
jgi:type IV pilus assembly protein PilY1